MNTTTEQGLAWTDVGSGESALLCIPGWCGDRNVFDPLLTSLNGSLRAISVDLPAHGDSASPTSDFGLKEVVHALEGVIGDAGLRRVIPVALSHGGWAAVELARRLGRERVPGVVLIDWMVLGPPPGFMDALGALQNPDAWEQVRSALIGMWTDGVDVPDVHRYVEAMAGYGFSHWSRGGREIGRSFAAEKSPLEALSRLSEPCPTLHVYAMPRDEELLAVQREFARSHPWFSVHRLEARSHFPMFEVPDEMAAVIERFCRDLP